jgi:diketogulonate reductase-like aldo/keto reductase
MHIPTRRIAESVHVPVLGLGVYQSKAGATARNAVMAALETGYRHIDTAAIYHNEEDVGEAIARTGIPRSEVFVTTKLWNTDHGYESTLKAADASLRRLGFEYIDLYLVHWPVPGKRAETWRAMEHLLADGRARAIGVSNFAPQHLDELDTYANVPPAVDQFELSPYLTRRNLVDACLARDIAVESYSPLTRGQKLDDPTLVEIGSRHEKSPAQVLIRWAIEHGFIVIPKSVHPERIRENADVFNFELSREDMTTLDGLDEDLATCWNPMDAP